jgi:CBS-domain-containing membrane protein
MAVEICCLGIDMKRGMTGGIHQFKEHWKNFVFQSLFATLVIFLILLSLSFQEDAVIIASLGATTFIVFAMPGQITAKPRNIIGGYIVGFSCGWICSLIPVEPVMGEPLGYSLLYAAAVGLSIFIMVVVDMEHPPASGVALGVAIKGFSLDVIISITVSVVVLTIIHHFFKKYLRDLT